VLFFQKKGIDYDETFTHVARYTSIRTIISLASVLGWKLYQMDVNTTFLKGQVEEEVYIEQPKSFVVQRKESHMFKLKKTLYGLVNAQFVSMSKGYKVEGQTGVTGTYPTQCHHDG
jgi:hypothetical protein